MVPGLMVTALAGCASDGETNDAWRVGPPSIPDTTLPDDDDSWKQDPTSKPGTGPAFHDGVATTSEPLAAQVGAAVLADGGNAIDAAAAAVFVLNVVEPQSSGLGGGGFMMVHLADTNETFVVNSRERAPAAATPDMFVSQPDAELRMTSGYAVGVPGELLGVATALQTWGTMTLSDALQPAIEAAQDGIVISTRLAADSQRPRLDNEPGNPAYEVARSVLRPGGGFLQAGETLAQPQLANTFQLIAQYGLDAFYDCDHPAGIAEAIVQTQLTTRTANPDGVGTMTCADLESYQVEIQSPIARAFRGYEVLSAGPPTSGGIAVLQMLGMLEQFPIGGAGFGRGQANTMNVMLEAMRLAFADRAMWVGDQTCPTCSPVPVAGLLSDAYLAQRGAMIQVGQRLTGITAGNPLPYDALLAGEEAPPFGVGPAVVVDEEGDTTHLSIIDADGNIVSYTTSIESTWGTALMAWDPGSGTNFGFLLNNQLTDFNRVPSVPPAPNDVAPFKRPRSSMAPTIVMLEGEAVAAYGSPGGATIINSVLSIALDWVDHRLSLQESVLAPRFSLSSASDTAIVDREAGFDAGVIGSLTALGYSFQIAAAPIGAVQAIITVPPPDKQYGFADERRIGGLAAADDVP